MHTCLIGFGANLGDGSQTLSAVVEQLDLHAEVHGIKVSRLVQTAPVGGKKDAPMFVNAIIRCETEWSPLMLLKRLLELEQRHGRDRRERWGNRTLDLDLLLYGTECFETVELTMPHPRMTYRRFVLVPACEVAPEMIHPVVGLSVRQLCDVLDLRPNRLLIVGDSIDALPSFHLWQEMIEGEFHLLPWQTDDSALRTPSNQWSVQSITDGIQAVPAHLTSRVKLTVVCQELDEPSRKLIQGPYLNLGAKCDAATLARELHAAMQAMSPWSVDLGESAAGQIG